MDQAHNDSLVPAKTTAGLGTGRTKTLSVTSAATLYVASLLLGALTLFGYFFLPHTAPLLIGLTVCTAVVLGAAFLSVRLAVQFFLVHRR